MASSVPYWADCGKDNLNDIRIRDMFVAEFMLSSWGKPPSKLPGLASPPKNVEHYCTDLSLYYYKHVVSGLSSASPNWSWNTIPKHSTTKIPHTALYNLYHNLILRSMWMWTHFQYLNVPCVICYENVQWFQNKSTTAYKLYNCISIKLPFINHMAIYHVTKHHVIIYFKMCFVSNPMTKQTSHLSGSKMMEGRRTVVNITLCHGMTEIWENIL